MHCMRVAPVNSIAPPTTSTTALAGCWPKGGKQKPRKNRVDLSRFNVPSALHKATDEANIRSFFSLWNSMLVMGDSRLVAE